MSVVQVKVFNLSLSLEPTSPSNLVRANVQPKYGGSACPAPLFVVARGGQYATAEQVILLGMRISTT